jgi:hypothetical protein
MLLLFLFNVATLWLLLLNTTIIPCSDIDIPYSLKFFSATPLLDLVVPCSLFDIAALVSNWYSPSSFFASVGGAVQIEVLHAKLGR